MIPPPENLQAYERHKFIIDPKIHRRARPKLNKDEFLWRLRNVNFIRMRKRRAFATVYISDHAEFERTELLHAIINDPEKAFRHDSLRYTFAILVPPKLYRWFRNTDLNTIQNQIIHWLAATYFTSESTQGILQRQLYKPVYRQMMELLRKHYATINPPTTKADFGEELEAEIQAHDDFVAHYQDTSRQLFHCPPPELLASPFDVLHEDAAWGNERYDFNLPMVFFREDDWQRIIVKKQANDDMHRVESVGLFWERWKHTFVNYETRKQAVFQLLADPKPAGWVYVVGEANSNRYKIGWTTKEDGAMERLKYLQTGNPSRLSLIGSFPVSSIRAERALHSYFEENKEIGEWFILAPDQVDCILSEEWRIINSIL